MTSNTTRGFTLIETLVAVLLLATAIAGPLTIAAQGLRAGLVAKDQLTAAYLAQDAMEHVRFLRDSACLAAPQDEPCGAGTWLGSMATCISADGSAACYFDSRGIAPAAPAACAGSGCPTMKYNSTTHTYDYSAAGSVVGTPGFVRTVRIISSATNDCAEGNGCEVLMEVVVSWKEQGGVQRQVVLRQNLFNWQ